MQNNSKKFSNFWEVNLYVIKNNNCASYSMNFDTLFMWSLRSEEFFSPWLCIINQWMGLYANFVHIQAKLGQESLPEDGEEN